MSTLNQNNDIQSNFIKSIKKPYNPEQDYTASFLVQ